MVSPLTKKYMAAGRWRRWPLKIGGIHIVYAGNTFGTREIGRWTEVTVWAGFTVLAGPLSFGHSDKGLSIFASSRRVTLEPTLKKDAIFYNNDLIPRKKRQNSSEFKETWFDYVRKHFMNIEVTILRFRHSVSLAPKCSANLSLAITWSINNWLICVGIGDMRIGFGWNRVSLFIFVINILFASDSSRY